jgi:hypothetical protein
VARCAANIMKVYFKNEKKPICIEIYVRSLKYTDIFNFVHEVRQKIFIYFTVRREPKILRTTVLGIRRKRSPILSHRFRRTEKNP